MNAQETLDMSNMECIYKFTQMRDTLEHKQVVYDPAMILLAGSKYTKFYSYTTFRSDSALSTTANMMDVIGKYPQGERYEVYRNNADNTVTLKDRVPHKIMYKEIMPGQNWKILNEIKTVAGYKCQKATCRFRGRDYVAWFTKEISVNAGPWKFHGLPGLIVKVYDTQEHYDFELYSVKKIRTAIVFDKTGYLDTSLKEHIRLSRNRIARLIPGDVNMTYTRNGTSFTPSAWQYDVMERDIR